MSTYVGLNLTLEHDIAGSASWSRFDKGTGSLTARDEAAYTQSAGIGGQATGYRGLYIPGGTATTEVQSIALLNCLKPASVGALPTVIKYIQGGPVNATTEGKKQSNCYLTSAKLACEVGGVLTADYEWLALDEEKVTIASAATAQTNSVVVWHTGSVLLGGAGYKCTGWEATASTGITAKTSLDAKSAGSQRLPEWADPGNFEVSLTARFRAPLGIDLSGDTVSTVAFKFTGTDAETTPKTFTLDLTGGSGLHLTSAPLELGGAADEVVWSITAVGELNDLALWACTFAAS